MNTFIHVRSGKFPLLPGEEKEMVNEGMVGKALALYLQDRLERSGYDAPFICCEDWGWWVELSGAPFRFGVCIYSTPPGDGLTDYYCTDGAIARSIWSWKSFRRIDTSPWSAALHATLLTIFRNDPEVELLGISPTLP